MTKIAEVIAELESIAPPMYQESYDNSGLLVGNKGDEVSGALVSLDVTEAVIEEAEKLNCNLVIAHHPLIFKGLKSITDDHWIGRGVRRAIKSDIAIYAIHTNLDNVLRQGVNGKIAERLGLQNIRVLAPKKGLLAFSMLVPGLLIDNIREGMEEIETIGLRENKIDYRLPFSGSQPEFQVTGEIMPHLRNAVQSLASRHRIPTSFSETQNTHPNWGSGVIGEFEMPKVEDYFLEFVKEKLNTPLIRHTARRDHSVTKVAVCGGAGSFLLGSAIAQGADAYITGDFKYHEFFEADGKILIADTGHYESEQFTIDLLFDTISNKFSTFALHCSKVNTNPVKYF